MTPQPATPYDDLNKVLSELVRGVHDVLGDNLAAAYLQGSFAVGDFDEHSDVDVLLAVHRDLNASDVAALDAMHQRVHRQASHWAQKLEGSYAPLAILRRWATEPRDPPDEPRTADWKDPETGGRPPHVYPFWFLNNGATSLVRSEHDNTQVVRWVVRERGITLFGPPAQSLIDPVSSQELRLELWATMESLASTFLATPSELEASWLQGFMAVLFARMLHSLHTGEIRSKRAAVTWAEQALEPSFAALVSKAWQQRYAFDEAFRAQASREDVQNTLAFMRHACALGRPLVEPAYK